VHVTELLPLQAQLMDRLAIVRNLRFGPDAQRYGAAVGAWRGRQQRRHSIGCRAAACVRLGHQPAAANLVQ